jgi:hypothetical protein
VRSIAERRAISDLLAPSQARLRTCFAFNDADRGAPEMTPFAPRLLYPGSDTLAVDLALELRENGDHAAIARPVGVVRSKASVNDARVGRHRTRPSSRE